MTRLKPTKLTICTNPEISNRGITRAEIAQILGSTVSWNQSQSVQLKDVFDTHPAYSQIQQAIALGWMSPDRNGRFFPKRLLTRDEGFAILTQALGVAKHDQTVETKQFSDFQQAADWTKPNLAIALTQGIVNLDRGIRPRDWMLGKDLCYGLVQLDQLRVAQIQAEKPAYLPWGVFGAIAIGTTGLFLLCRKPTKPTPPRISPPPIAEVVKCLQVTEQQVSASGEVKILAQNVKVLLFPASFGDQRCTYVVKSLPQVDGQIFTIAISPHGGLVLTPHPQKALLCNGMPVSIEGITLEQHAPSRIEYQQGRWLIQPLIQSLGEVPQRKTSAAYFAQLDAL